MEIYAHKTSKLDKLNIESLKIISYKYLESMNLGLTIALQVLFIWQIGKLFR